jgi:hypothetical protein
MNYQHQPLTKTSLSKASKRWKLTIIGKLLGQIWIKRCWTNMNLPVSITRTRISKLELGWYLHLYIQMEREPTIKHREQRWVNELENAGFLTDFDGRQFRRIFQQISTSGDAMETIWIPIAAKLRTASLPIEKNWSISFFWWVRKGCMLVTTVSHQEIWEFHNVPTGIIKILHHHMTVLTYLMEWDQAIWLIVMLVVVQSTNTNTN